MDGFGWVPSHPERPGIVTNVLLQTLKNVIFAMKCLKVPRTHKILDPAPRPMTPWIQVKSASDKPQLAGRQPSSAVGCPG